MERAADISVPGELESRYSATSCDRNSYDTVCRVRGRIWMSPRRIKMLPCDIKGQIDQSMDIKLTYCNEGTWSTKIHSGEL